MDDLAKITNLVQRKNTQKRLQRHAESHADQRSASTLAWRLGRHSDSAAYGRHKRYTRPLCLIYEKHSADNINIEYDLLQSTV